MTEECANQHGHTTVTRRIVQHRHIYKHRITEAIDTAHVINDSKKINLSFLVNLQSSIKIPHKPHRISETYGALYCDTSPNLNVAHPNIQELVAPIIRKATPFAHKMRSLLPRYLCHNLVLKGTLKPSIVKSTSSTHCNNGRQSQWRRGTITCTPRSSVAP